MMSQDHVGSDQTQIIKGKRTKRQRSSSSAFLVAAAAATNTSSSSSAGDGGGGKTVSDEYSSVVSSPVTTTDCTKEEEDMAICLIMLAQGAALSPDLKNSRKTEKVLSSAAENSSFYVYECKTCSRTFSSFQALGGHRASHKKPRASIDEKTKLPLMQAKFTESEGGQESHFKVSGSPIASLSSNICMSKANKVHECSICGSEFASGQALGGHMRRHRAVTTGEIPVATTEVSRSSTEEETENLSSYIGQRKYLPLDLNLPAPEDDLRESKFQGILFSTTSALIDCHF